MSEQDTLKSIMLPYDVVAFDPGKNTGISYWNWETGEHLRSIRTLGLELTQLYVGSIVKGPIKWMIIEKYIPNQQVKRADLGEALQVIGMVKGAGAAHNIPVVEQMPADRLIAAKWAEVRIPRGHMPDDLSAYLHGYYFMRTRQRIQTPLEARNA